MVSCSHMQIVVRLVEGERGRKLLVTRKPPDEAWKQKVKELEKQTAKTGERVNRMFSRDVN